MGRLMRADRRRHQALLVVPYKRWGSTLLQLGMGSVMSLGSGAIFLWSDGFERVFVALTVMAGLLLVWSSLCEIGRIATNGCAFRIDRSGLHVPGEGIISWRRVKTYRLSGGYAGFADTVRSVQITLNPSPNSAPRPLWAWFCGVWESRGASSLTLGCVHWRIAASVLQAALDEGAWRYGSAALRNGLRIAAAPKSSGAGDSAVPCELIKPDFEQARTEAVRLILAGRKASDPALKAAWARADAARPKPNPARSNHPRVGGKDVLIRLSWRESLAMLFPFAQLLLAPIMFSPLLGLSGYTILLWLVFGSPFAFIALLLGRDWIGIRRLGYAVRLSSAGVQFGHRPSIPWDRIHGLRGAEHWYGRSKGGPWEALLVSLSQAEMESLGLPRWFGALAMRDPKYPHLVFINGGALRLSRPDLMQSFREAALRWAPFFDPQWDGEASAEEVCELTRDRQLPLPTDPVLRLRAQVFQLIRIGLRPGDPELQAARRAYLDAVDERSRNEP